MTKTATHPGINGTDQGLLTRTGLCVTALRTCCRCRTEKPPDYFATDKTKPDGHRTIGAGCRSDYDHQRYYQLSCHRYGIEPAIKPFSRKEVIERHGNRCVYCTAGDFEALDHFVPVAAGGAHTPDNARPSCRSCNGLKFWLDDRSLVHEFRRSQDVLEPSAPLLKLQGQRKCVHTS